MKFLYNSALLSAAILFFSTANATVWRVNNTGGINANFTTAQSAHDGASSGDTLLFEGSTQSYGNISINKKLVIIGPGYFLGQNPQTQANFSTALIPSVTFTTGSSGSVMTGIDITYQGVINESGIIFKRNYVHSSYGLSVSANRSNIVITQNYMEHTSNTYSVFYINSNCSNIILTNNIILNNGTNSSVGMDPSASSTITNNVFKGNLVLNNCNFANNIFISGNHSGTNNFVQNSICNLGQFPAGNGNQDSVTISSVFVGLTGNSTDGQYKLASGSPAIGAGSSGEDCGAYGGVDPYILSGMPAVPAIFYFSAPGTGSSSQGLPVSIKVKSHK
jgi:hypothetical protein